VLAKAGTLFGVAAIALLLVGGIGAAFGVELPTRPTIDTAPMVQPVPEVNEGPVVPAQPLPDPTTTTTAPARPPQTYTTAPSRPSAGGTAVSFTITPRTQ
jgi:hypothetical protein